jgi:hypothetical protein
MSHPLNTPLDRFGIVTSEEGPQRCIASIPAGEMTNPLSGQPTVAALAMLVDHIGGLVNHHRRGPSQWTVSSELSLELAPDALAQIAAAPDEPVIATARPSGRNGPNALGLCEFTHRDFVIANATVRSFYIQGPGHLAKWPAGPTGPPLPGSLAERMAVRVAAAVNDGREDEPLHTASLRVNFLRQFYTVPSSPESRYEGTALHVGRSSGVAEARGVGADGKAAIIARVTAYC